MPKVFPQTDTSLWMYKAFYRVVKVHVPRGGDESQLLWLPADRPDKKVFHQDVIEASCDPAHAKKMGFCPKRAWEGSARDLHDLLIYLLGRRHPASVMWGRQLNSSHEKGSKHTSGGK